MTRPDSRKWETLFAGSAAAILIVTAVLKVISAFSKVKILAEEDAVFMVQTRWVFVLAAAAELTVACFLLSAQAMQMKHMVLLWLASTFVAYRLALIYLNVSGHCSCLGYATDWMKIKPAIANAISAGLLAYLFIGSAAFSLINWAAKRGGRAAAATD